MEYKLNELELIKAPMMPDQQIIIANIKRATKEWSLWKDPKDGHYHLQTTTPPKNSVVWGIVWDEVKSKNSL